MIVLSNFTLVSPGIDELGRVGSLQRNGQANVSTACGAAIGAYKELQKKKKVAADPLVVLEQDNPSTYDPQLSDIVKLLAPRLNGIEQSADSISFVTYQMYGIIRELITACITENADVFDFATEVAVVGGVMINRRKVSHNLLYICDASSYHNILYTVPSYCKGGDFFQPLSFETQRKGEAPIDLFEEAFGEKPNLLPVLGTFEAMERASLY